MANVIVKVLVGAPGSGKSTYANSLTGTEKTGTEYVTHLSSDLIRLELFETLSEGNKHNAEVFKEMKARLFEQVQSGTLRDNGQTTIIYDATNTSRKRRRSLYRELKIKFGDDVMVEVNIFSELLSTLLERNEQREGEAKVPEHVIKRMYIGMQPPRLNVDCDAMFVHGTPFFDRPIAENSVEGLVVAMGTDIRKEADIFSPHNCGEWHKESIDEHIQMCVDNSKNPTFKLVSLFHDLGKPVSRVTEDGYSRYKGHANVGAMYLLNYLWFTSGIKKMKLYGMVEVVLRHMDAHQGIGDKNIRNNGLEEIIWLIEEFAHIDSKSRIKGGS